MHHSLLEQFEKQVIVQTDELPVSRQQLRGKKEMHLYSRIKLPWPIDLTCLSRESKIVNRNKRTIGRSSDSQASLYIPTHQASHLKKDSALEAFVPDYRCGAVPDLHRIPSCDTPLMGDEPTARPYILWGRSVVNSFLPKIIICVHHVNG
jgi:hypothetical protein